MSDYPHSLDTRPLTTWPGVLTVAHRRVRSSFSAGLRQTLSTLTTELSALGARHPVLEVAIAADQWRLDGRPRANAREDHPGVVLSLPTTKVGPLRYATDTFTTWQDNLRAIALGLEALRKVDRYGITRRGEQYAGFRQLPPGTGLALPSASMTVDDAARLVAMAGDYAPWEHLLSDPELLARVYRRAAKAAHPDAGADRASWDSLELARRVLDAHAGRSVS